MPKVTNAEKLAKQQAKQEAKYLKRLNKKMAKGKQYRAQRMTPENIATRAKNATATHNVLSQWRAYRRHLYILEQKKKEFLRKHEQDVRATEKTITDLWNELRELNPGSCRWCGLFGGHFGKADDDGCGNIDCEYAESDPDIECLGSDVECDEDTLAVRWGKDYTEEQLVDLARRNDAVVNWFVEYS